MRDDRDQPLHPMPSAEPTRPQLGARPFAGGRGAAGRQAEPTGPSTPARSLRPFVPRQVARAAEPAAEQVEQPRMPEPAPEPVQPGPPSTSVSSVSRRTPRMLAALVEEEQVAIWPVDASLEGPALPASPNEPEATLTEWPSHAAPAAETMPEPQPEIAEAADETIAAEPVGLPQDPHSAANQAPAHQTSMELPEWTREAPTPSVESFLAQPSPQLAIPADTPPIESTLPAESPAAETACVLEAIADRIRSGEIVVAQALRAAGKGSDAAVLAAVLASLLGGHDRRSGA